MIRPSSPLAERKRLLAWARAQALSTVRAKIAEARANKDPDASVYCVAYLAGTLEWLDSVEHGGSGI